MQKLRNRERGIWKMRSSSGVDDLGGGALAAQDLVNVRRKDRVWLFEKILSQPADMMPLGHVGISQDF